MKLSKNSYIQVICTYESMKAVPVEYKTCESMCFYDMKWAVNGVSCTHLIELCSSMDIDMYRISIGH